jgi:hypothetical protein
MELRLLVLTVFTILATVNGTYAPVSFRSIGALQARNTRRDGSLLRPRSQVELFYADSMYFWMLLTIISRSPKQG